MIKKLTPEKRLDYEKRKQELKENFSGLKKQQQSPFENKLEKTANKLESFGKKLTVGLTIPIILFFIGLVTFPAGVIFWIIGILIFLGMFTKS